MNKRVEKVLNILPAHIRNLLAGTDSRILGQLEEIRLRIGAPVMAYTRDEEFSLSKSAKADDFSTIIENITKNSMYAYLEDIKCGFITIEGGHRIGLCGTAVTEGGNIINIKDIHFLNIRIAREIIGVSDPVMPDIYAENQIRNTLIISPPQAGKTTLLRDISRNLSAIEGLKIVLIDERGELSSVYRGMPQNNVGIRTFVMTGYSKANGIAHAVRGLSPTVILTDELGGGEDVEAVFTALNSGVRLITTVHGDSIEEVRRRERFAKLFAENVFRTIIILNKQSPNRIKEVIHI